MMKIAKVITTCNDCEHCKKMKSPNDNHATAFVCVYESESETEVKPFLLSYSESPGTFRLDIPDNCPLEDYKSTEL